MDVASKSGDNATGLIDVGSNAVTQSVDGIPDIRYHHLQPVFEIVRVDFDSRPHVRHTRGGQFPELVADLLHS